MNELYNRLQVIKEAYGNDFIIEEFFNCFDSNIVKELVEHLEETINL